jgi:hypothetical protein
MKISKQFALLTAFNRVTLVFADSASQALEQNSHLSPKGIAEILSPYRSI